ncbi:uncharacterized protein LOC112083558 [Eutrema salsugineum]|uniref:uncharacterized protein LOC112083558 n=1 Tax=Eutrema salsugineum TaxID=72664 RepID=UPI000CED26EB|nr:uncharacterized protein LOC112083558 [Eutrema salsugineum]
MKRKNGNEDESGSSSLSSDKGSQESREPCEICGSVGIAGLMMICFKCRETREHTYCTRVFLPSVPPIWLCEVCRFSSRILLISDVAGDLMDSETTVADCSSDPKNSNRSGVEDHETTTLRTNAMEEAVDAEISLPVILQALTSDSRYEISANVSPVSHLPLQPPTSPLAKETSSIFNDTSQIKEQHQPSRAFPKKTRTIRVLSKHLAQPHQTRISSLDQSLTEMPHQSVNQERFS